jgi:hypothetical protein
VPPSPSPALDCLLANCWTLTTLLVESTGVQIDYPKLFERLKEVADGDLTLIEGLDEAIQQRERQHGGPLSESDQELLQRIHRDNRRAHDDEFRDIAQRIARHAASVREQHLAEFPPRPNDDDEDQDPSEAWKTA